MSFARAAAAALLALAAAAAVALPASTCVPRDGVGGALALSVNRAGALVCHQRPERSLASCGVRWPVCGRCSGLYLAAGATAWLSIIVPWRIRRSHAWWRRALMAAAVPTAALWLGEAAGIAFIGNSARLLGAVPLGVVGAAWLRAVAAGDLR